MKNAMRYTMVGLMLIAGTSFAQQAASRPVAARDADVSTTDLLEMVRKSRMELTSADLAALMDRKELTFQDIAKVIQDAQALVKQPVAPASDSRASSRPAGSSADKPVAPPVKMARVEPAGRPTTQSAADLAIEEIQRSECRNPMAMADSFCRAGRLREAVVLYEKALKSGLYPNDKDWLLFQLAVCREKDNPAASVELYGRLQTQCPQSPWVAMAKARLNVAQWMLSDDVREALGGPAASKRHQ